MKKNKMEILEYGIWNLGILRQARFQIPGFHRDKREV